MHACMSMCVGGTSGKEKNKACNWQDLHFYQIYMRVPFVCIQASVYCLDFFFFSDYHCVWGKMDSQCSLNLHFSDG